MSDESSIPPPRSAADLVARYRSGSLSPVDVVEASLGAAEIARERYAAFASIDVEGARAAAVQSAERWRRGEPLGALDGVPISFKDSFHVRGMPRWHGTAVNPGVISADDAAPVRRAREAGMPVIGKTTMPDYAMLMSGLSSQHGVIRNPWDPDTNPAGSSAGAGPSVTAGAAFVAVGTDMVGSVRLPAAVSALASIKPTQGRIAYDPAGNYRSAGPMARTVDDVERSLEVLGREDERDHFSLPGAYRAGAERDRLDGVRIGVLREIAYGTPVDAETATATDVAATLLQRRGATLVDVADLPLGPADYASVYWYMLYKGLPDYLAQSPLDRARILPQIGRMLEQPLAQSAAFAAESAHTLAVATEKVRRHLHGLDFVLSPALPVRRFAATAVSPDPADPMSHMGFACWFNQLGRPAGTVPVFDPGDGMCPVSVQVAGARFDDAGVLAVMRMLESDRGFAITYPGDRT